MNQVLMKEKGAQDFYNIPAVNKKLLGQDPIRGAFDLAYKDTQRTMWGTSSFMVPKQLLSPVTALAARNVEIS